eukprot:GHVS01064800.1.p1 GENE.GHVS01064800.1~~GHVS01064800.1.p1  ORF type:complete len:347 (+),score=24.39 GHVS01064800.1:34-1041(+)
MSEQGTRKKRGGQKAHTASGAKRKGGGDAGQEEETAKKWWVLANFSDDSKACRNFPTRLLLTEPMIFRTKNVGQTTVGLTDGVKETPSVGDVHLFGVLVRHRCQGCCNHHQNQPDNASAQGHKGKKRLLDSHSGNPDSEAHRNAEAPDFNSHTQACKIQPGCSSSPFDLPPSHESQLSRSINNNKQNGGCTNGPGNVVKRSRACTHEQAPTSHARGDVPPSSGNASQLRLRLRLKGGVVAEVLQTASKRGCEGADVTHASRIRVNYVGRLAHNGKKFDSGMLRMTVGSGEVIPGMEAGVAGMKEGERPRWDMLVRDGIWKAGSPSVYPRWREFSI